MEPKQRTFSIGYLVIALVAMVILQSVLLAPHAENLSYSEFKTLVKKGKVSNLILDKQTISGALSTEGLETLLPKEKLEELKRLGGGTHQFVTARVDDPGLVDWWDMLKPEPSVEAYRQFARLRIDAVNHALAGIPEESVRYHLCWGSWHGPHTHDLPLEHIIDLILEVKAQTYSFEAANVRHEHEWRVWQNAKLPPGKMLMPGVVSHATNLVEHPQLVADRILRYAAIVGRENVVAGTDCGLGGRVHADLAWAKLRTLAEGARLASQPLWP